MSADWIKAAKAGDEIICINDRGFTDVIHRGSKYAIQFIYEDEGALWVALVGVCERSDAPGFSPSRFRPVEPRKTDISFAHEILRKASKPVREDA